MALWGMKYVDVDDRWWVDLVCQEPAPEVDRLMSGSRVFADGFRINDGRVLVKKASVAASDLPDWPSDTPVILRPDPGSARASWP